MSINKVENKEIINIDFINKRILNEICNDTIASLTDERLLYEYNECKSVKNKIDILEKILEKHHIHNEKKELIINDYLLKLIHA